MPTPSLTRTVRSVAARASRRPRTTVLLWFAMVIALAVGGGMLGVESVTGLDTGVGQSGSADRTLAAADLRERAVENVLVTSSSPATTRRAAAALQRRLARSPAVASAAGPAQQRALRTDAGRSALVQVTLRGDPDDATEAAQAVARIVERTGRAQDGARFQQAGPGSFEKSIDEVVGDDLAKAELVSLPVTLLILLAAFGALLAASIPLVLGLSAVAAAVGGMSFYSQLAPVDDVAFSLIVLIGLAVGVDYSLFAVRRLREERAAGRAVSDALDVTAATVGRAIVVSGATVVIAIAGLLGTGLPVFTSVAAGTILVVVLAVLGSLTVLPALLTLTGERVARAPRFRRRAKPGLGAWGGVARAVTRRPALALVTACCLLGSLGVVATQMHTEGEGTSALPQDLPVVKAGRAISARFSGSPDPATLVVRGSGLGTEREALRRLGEQARALGGARGAVDVRVARDGRTAAVSVPVPVEGAGGAAVERIRSELVPRAASTVPGASVEVTGSPAQDLDFSDRLKLTTPIVVAGVLLLAFGLLLVSFRSPWLAAGVVGLNLLSVGAAYGVMVGVFQYTWAEDLLGFTSTGAIVDWLPLLAFVILFGISMDYTVLVLERVREARRAGMDARQAAAEGVARTAGSVTSAAVVMVAVFAILGTLRLLSMKQLGLGLAAAVLIDATVVRAIALPALLALLGERRWRPWDDRRREVLVATGAGGGR